MNSSLETLCLFLNTKYTQISIFIYNTRSCYTVKEPKRAHYTKYLCTSHVRYFFLLPLEDPEEARDSGCLDEGRGEGVDNVCGCGVTTVLTCPDAGLVEVSVDRALVAREPARSARSRERIFSNAILSSFSASKARCSA